MCDYCEGKKAFNASVNNKNTYIEQYISLNRVLPFNLNEKLMKALKEIKDPINEGRIKKAHELIDYYENNVKKLELYQKVIFEIMVVCDKHMLC